MKLNQNRARGGVREKRANWSVVLAGCVEEEGGSVVRRSGKRFLDCALEISAPSDHENNGSCFEQVCREPEQNCGRGGHLVRALDHPVRTAIQQKRVIGV